MYECSNILNFGIKKYFPEKYSVGGGMISVLPLSFPGPSVQYCIDILKRLVDDAVYGLIMIMDGTGRLQNDQYAVFQISLFYRMASIDQH